MDKQIFSILFEEQSFICGVVDPNVML